ncbi:protein SLOW GREEN 1, chloroplastic [Iris pallida]|uniref:Protein SLOW GREEN 1, chloroplastic n=1 Tax=Iris pallida TaxID=29817 RepID=A0AAX6G757_IRIPA|nr:protein SLOW GREEN 1, chloroplastic [Iris pallida]
MPRPHRPPLRQALRPFPRHRRPGPAARRRARINLQPHRALLRNHRLPSNPPLPEAQRRRGLRRRRPPRPPPTPLARRARVEVPCHQAPQRDGRHRVLPEDLRGDPRGRPPLLRGPLRERRPHGPLRRASRRPPGPRVGAGGRRLGEVESARDVKLILAQVKFLQKDVEEALEIYEELVREDPKDYRPWFCQGVIYSLTERNKEAREKFAKYKELVPKKFEVDAYLQSSLSRTKLFGTEDS